ncbi:mismatch repair ATPase MSH1 TDEL_0B05090 [Torulaspora delbrueckii]|uniref:DNA mismatch repair proteins mutS family domain-containing protein n=1 Tax=Torulaspora delbrueckii TaxID=4950 RepID=G8ZPU4_TORDE|nr:hypothetical protein TDEL_0B05090 [Torulaspora delbrueckii]CCE90638.1 hypothetical protein TDEL_0B05090 [Torulaspora delbrueckii]
MIRSINSSLSRSFFRYNHGLVAPSPGLEVSKLTIVMDSKKAKANKEAFIETSLPPLLTTRAKRSSKKGTEPASGQNETNLPPSLQYVRDLMDHYKGHVVLTQMGSFYELYFEQASVYGPQLNLSLTNRNYFCGKVPFAGFPVHQLSRHLKILVNNYGYSVTIAEQFKRDTVANNDVNKFYRRVTRIVTPGTFIDEAFENLQENTYLLSIEFSDNCFNKIADSNLKVGLCWCDVTTGEIFVQQVLLKDLISSITRIQPKEILLNDELAAYRIESGEWYPELVELKKYFIKYQKLPSRHRTIASFYNLFSAADAGDDRKQLEIQLREFSQKELAALRNTLMYVSEHMPSFSMNFQLPQRQLTGSIMQIDSRTVAALELHKTVRDNRQKGTLLSTIRRTVTPAGTRLLTQWLSGPSLDLKEIKARQDIVAFFKTKFGITKSIISMLRNVQDLPRILQKFSFGRGDALELIQLAQSLQIAIDLRTFLEEESLSYKKKIRDLVSSLTRGLKFDRTLIKEVIDNLNEAKLVESLKESERENDEETGEETNGSGSQDALSNDTPIVNSACTPRLQQLHIDYQKLKEARGDLELEFFEFFVDGQGAKSVTLKQKQSGEYALHVLGSAGNLKKINEFIKSGQSFHGSSFHIIQQSSQTRWLSHEAWSDLGYRIELAALKIKDEENRIINDFKNEFLKRSNEVRVISDLLGYLDVLSSFAVLAKEKNLVCPRVDQSDKLEIIDGRHIMVEDGLAAKCLENFIENDCLLNGGKLWIITGPNMGGKSTFLRQNAIIVLLAQMGSFVPCSKAHIGLVDKVFSRVGSADDLYNEMSTFMVEMIETSFILHGATRRSLAILDEIGRGTSGREGVSIAYATLQHLAQENGCRSLFATHFGAELSKIISSDENSLLKEKASFMKSSIVELSEDDFFYDYKLRPGICNKSDAIKVAKTAGFPEKALNTAQALLS